MREGGSACEDCARAAPQWCSGTADRKKNPNFAPAGKQNSVQNCACQPIRGDCRRCAEPSQFSGRDNLPRAGSSNLGLVTVAPPEQPPFRRPEIRTPQAGASSFSLSGHHGARPNAGSKPPSLTGGKIGEGHTGFRLLAPFALPGDRFDQRKRRRPRTNQRNIGRYRSHGRPPAKAALVRGHLAPPVQRHRPSRGQPRRARGDNLDNGAFHDFNWLAPRPRRRGAESSHEKIGSLAGEQ